MEIKIDNHQISNNRALRFLIISSIFLMSIINLAQAERLPIVSGDSGAWGTVLNNFLLLEHTQNGTHRNITIAGDLTMTNASNNIALLFNSSTGRLGIGTANPLASLHINRSQSTSFEAIRVTNLGTTDSSFMFFQRPSSPSRGLVIGHQASHADMGADYQNTSYITAQGDVSQDIGIQAGNGSDGSGSVGRIYLAEAGGNVGIGTNLLDSKLTVSGNLSVTAGALLATSSGKVGIGTTSPLSTLHVNGTGTQGGFLVTNNSNYTVFSVNSTEGTIGIGTSAGKTNRLTLKAPGNNFVTIRALQSTNDTSPIFDVWDATDNGIVSLYDSADAETVRIRAGGGVSWMNGGSVGINTTNPAQTLTVQGTLNVTGNSTGVGDLFVSSLGRVGVGTTNPSGKLDIESTALDTSNGALFLGPEIAGTFITLGGGYRHIGVQNGGAMFISQNSYYDASATGFRRSSTSAGATLQIGGGINEAVGDFIVSTTAAGGSIGDAVSMTPRFFVKNSNGNIGINTTNPAQALTVQGTFNVTSQSTRDADFLINSNGAINITGNLTIGSKASSNVIPSNITMYSPNASIWRCGVDNTGTFSCSMA